MMTTEVSNFNNFKTDAINSQVLSKRVLLRDLEFNEGMSLNMNGVNIPVENSAYFALIRALGLNKTVFNNFGDVLGTGAQKAIIKAMKQANNKAELVVTVNPKTKRIVNIANSDNSCLSNKGFFGVFDEIMNIYPNLDIKSFDINKMGEITVNAINNDWDLQVPGMNKEAFKLGLSFKNSIYTGTSIKPYNLRLICTNGMMTTEEAGFGLILNKADQKGLNQFFEEAKNLSKQKKEYSGLMIEKIRGASNIVASYDELHTAYSLVKGACSVNALSEREKHGMIDTFFPLEEINNAYERHGIEIQKMTKKAQRNAKTNMPVWDVINNLTNIASHEYGLGMDTNDKFRIQTFAGKLMFKNQYDCENLIPEIKF